MTQKNIGQNFHNELKVAGLLGLPFSWGSDGSFEYGAGLSQHEIDAIQAIYEAHDPEKPDVVSEATALLTASDTTMHRIAEAVAAGNNEWTNPDVAAWATYRRALRAILTTSSGDIPTKPAYPAGT